MLAEEIRKRDLQHAGRMISGICDTSAFANVGLGQSRAAVMNKMGYNWRPATKGSGSRVQGIQSIHRLLRGTARDGGPALRFFSRCERLIEIPPTLPRSKYDPEDIDANAEDHCSDALAYGLQYDLGLDFPRGPPQQCLMGGTEIERMAKLYGQSNRKPPPHGCPIPEKKALHLSVKPPVQRRWETDLQQAEKANRVNPPCPEAPQNAVKHSLQQTSVQEPPPTPGSQAWHRLRIEELDRLRAEWRRGQ